MKTLFTLLALFTFVAFMSCGGDDLADCTSNDFAQMVNAEIAALNAAGNAWANDPSQANCDAFKDAARDYLDAVEDLDGCAGVSQAEYDAAVASARDAVDQIPCN